MPLKIVRAHAFGNPDQLVVDDVALPDPGFGQVRIRAKAVGVNPVDWKLLSGKAPVLPPLPLVPGGDIAGVIDAIGEGVEGFAEGDAVFAHPGLTGCYAEAMAIDADHVAHSPKGLDMAGAASLPLAALTAWQGFLADGRDLSGLHVLVHNSAGGVGSIAVQLVKAHGGRVTGTASAANADFVRDLGADDVVDFRSIAVDGRPHDVDILLDLVGDSREAGLWSLVRNGGSVIRIAGGATAAAEEEHDGVRAYKVRVRPNGAQLATIAALVGEGKLRPSVARQLPLAQAADALSLSKAGHMCGKIVLTID